MDFKDLMNKKVLNEVKDNSSIFKSILNTSGDGSEVFGHDLAKYMNEKYKHTEYKTTEPVINMIVKEMKKGAKLFFDNIK